MSRSLNNMAFATGAVEGVAMTCPAISLTCRAAFRPGQHLLQARAMVAFAPYASVIGSFARRIIGPASA
jgi:hypothetical protein